MKRSFIVIIYLFLVTEVYCQNKSYVIFGKDSTVSATNYINKFKIIDSLVVELDDKNLVISEKDILSFYEKTDDEELGVCPFVTDIYAINKRLLLLSAIYRDNFGTSFYLFVINSKLSIIKTIKIETAKKGVNTLSLIASKHKFYIPKKQNHISDSRIKVVDHKQNHVNFIYSSSKDLKNIILGSRDKYSEKETFFAFSLK